jgi:uncharacterized protein
MSRLLLIAAGIAIVYWLLRSYRNSASSTKAPPAASEDMVRCSQCGVHLPKSESILAGGKFFCSEAHRSAHSDSSK